MNAKETKAKMDRNVDIRKLLAKLDRELFGLRMTLSALQRKVLNESTVECTIELTDDKPYQKPCLADTVEAKDE